MARRTVLVCLLVSVVSVAQAKGQASGTPAEVVQRFQQDLSKNHLQSISPMFDSAAQVIMAGSHVGTVPFAGTYSGQAQIDALLNQLGATLCFEDVTFQYMVTSGNRVVSHFDITAEVLSTGKVFDLEWALVWDFAANNQVTALHVFYDTYNLWLAFQPGGSGYVTDLRPSPPDLVLRPVSYDVTAVIGDAYQQFFSGNVPAVLPLFTDATQWVLKGSPSLAQVGIFVGADGFAEFLYRMFQVEQAIYVAPFPQVYWVIGQGNRAEAFIMEPQMNPATGAVAYTQILHSFALDDAGHLVQMDSFNDSYELYRVFVQGRLGQPARRGGFAPAGCRAAAGRRRTRSPWHERALE